MSRSYLPFILNPKPSRDHHHSNTHPPKMSGQPPIPPPHNPNNKPTRTTRTRAPSGRFESSVDSQARICASCGKTNTPQWRTAPDGSTVCNPCGIRLNRKPTGTSKSGGSSSSGRRKSTSPTGSSQQGASGRSSHAGGSSNSPPKKKRRDAHDLKHILN